MSKLANHQNLNSSKSNGWFTPPHYLKAVREVLGAIDLDPASCETANRIVRATRYFTAEDNGYGREWHGRIFLNPPYGHCWPNGDRGCLHLGKDIRAGSAPRGIGQSG